MTTTGGKLPRPEAAILRAGISIPDAVVFRAFASETIILNLDTGKYHGLNPTAGRMFEVLAETLDGEKAVELLATEYDRPYEDVARDLCRFCLGLEARGLIALNAANR